MTNAVEEGTSNTTKAARLCGVPRTTLCDRTIETVTHGVTPGPKPYLTMEEETKLAEFAVETASVGCGKTKSEVK